MKAASATVETTTENVALWIAFGILQFRCVAAWGAVVTDTLVPVCLAVTLADSELASRANKIAAWLAVVVVDRTTAAASLKFAVGARRRGSTLRARFGCVSSYRVLSSRARCTRVVPRRTKSVTPIIECP